MVEKNFICCRCKFVFDDYNDLYFHFYTRHAPVFKRIERWLKATDKSLESWVGVAEEGMLGVVEHAPHTVAGKGFGELS